MNSYLEGVPQPYLGDLMTMVINNVLTGMTLQVSMNMILLEVQMVRFCNHPTPCLIELTKLWVYPGRWNPNELCCTSRFVRTHLYSGDSLQDYKEFMGMIVDRLLDPGSTNTPPCPPRAPKKKKHGVTNRQGLGPYPKWALLLSCWWFWNLKANPPLDCAKTL